VKGVERTVEILDAEVQTAMRLLGVERLRGLGVRYVSAVFAWIEEVNLRADDAKVNTRALEQVIYDRPAGLEGNVLRVRPKL